MDTGKLNTSLIYRYFLLCLMQIENIHVNLHLNFLTQWK